MMLGQLLGDAKESNKVQITIGGRDINPEKVHLLMLGESYYNSVAEYLEMNSLTEKFSLYKASIQIGLAGDDFSDKSSLQSLVLVMNSDEVLFEYTLSQRMSKLTDDIRGYAFQKEVEEVDGKK